MSAPRLHKKGTDHGALAVRAILAHYAQAPISP
jgi:hypothetical protein